jgi:hypothetical protein
MAKTYTITVTHEQREKFEDLAMRMNNLRGMYLIKDTFMRDHIMRLADRSTEIGYETCNLIEEIILDPAYLQDAKARNKKINSGE